MSKTGLSAEEARKWEVEWYREHGQHPERVRVNIHGEEYVQPDLLWNMHNPRKRESVCFALANYVADRYHNWKGKYPEGRNHAS